MPASTRTTRTFRLDLMRALPSGVLETLGSTFAILIAVRHFGMPSSSKAMLVAATSAGYLGSLFMVPLVRRLGWSAAKAGALLWLAAAFALLLVFPAGGNAGIFFAACVFAAFLPPLAIPLLSQVLNTNYGPAGRGRLFAFASMARMATAMAAALAIGNWLDSGMGKFPWLFLLYGLCALLAAACIWRIECETPPEGKNVRLLGAFRHARRDHAFRKLLMVWMLLGFGNLISVALFVEFAANPKHGLSLSSTTVGALTGTLPVGCAMASVVFWGWLFDRGHFYRVRGLINLLFVVATICYFSGGSLAMMAVGMAAHGVARAGGDVSWNLWVTKFADEDDVAEYMSVHAFLTGLRGLLAPFIGFYLIDHYPPQTVAWLCAGLILAGTALIGPEMLDPNRRGGRSPSLINRRQM